MSWFDKLRFDMARVQRSEAKRAALEELQRRESAANNLIEFVDYLTPFEYLKGWFHEELCETFDGFLRACEAGTSPRILLSVPPRHGKALDADTPIPTPFGLAPIRHLRTGDLVIGADGRPTRVLGVQRWHHRPCFEVTSDDDMEPIICDAQHEWVVAFNGDEERTLAAQKLFELQEEEVKRRACPSVRMVQVKGQHNPSLCVDPYTLGAWLGDGFSDRAYIGLHRDEVPHFRKFIKCPGEFYVRRQNNNVTTLRMGGLKGPLRALGVLNNKHIPEQYFYASIEQRMELLRGLVDTDGHVEPRYGMVEITSTLPQLARDIQRLVHTLGCKCSLRKYDAKYDGKKTGDRYVMRFYMKGCAHMPRKKGATRDATHRHRRRLTFTKVAPRSTTICIEVEDPSHCYVAGRGYALTHNSTVASRYFPPYVLSKHPDWEVVAATYNQEFADDLGRDVRDIINDPRFIDICDRIRVDKRANSVSYIRTLDRGSYTSTGVGASLTGRGAHVLIIDDPVKDREEANSERYRQRVWQWYQSVASTRISPGGGIIIIGTRWHEDDLIGRCIERAENNPEADQWHIISYPAIATENEKYRSKGEALHPERFPVRELERKRHSLDPYEWSALYQQRPAPEEGAFFKKEWFDYYEPGAEPALTKAIVADLAISSKESGDFTVIWPFGVSSDHTLYFLPDVLRAKLDTFAIVEALLDKAVLHDATCIIIEKGPISRTLIPVLRHRMRERGQYFQILEPTPTKDKMTRARPLQGRMQQGMVKFADTRFMREHVEHAFLTFPAAKHDDEVDAAAWAALTLETMPAPIEKEEQYELYPHLDGGVKPERYNRHVPLTIFGKVRGKRDVSGNKNERNLTLPGSDAEIIR